MGVRGVLAPRALPNSGITTAVRADARMLSLTHSVTHTDTLQRHKHDLAAAFTRTESPSVDLLRAKKVQFNSEKEMANNNPHACAQRSPVSHFNKCQ